MRRLLPLALLASVLALVPSAGAGTLFVITGRGWGHGVGMSQWGAYGLAKQGRPYQEILAHYYRGTTVATRATRTVGVQLAAGRTSVVVGSAAPFKVRAGTRSVTHAAGGATVTRTSTGRVKVEGISGTFASPATFSATTTPLRLGSDRYRGTLVVNVSGGALRVVNRLGLELYVRGVVPNESPSSWPAHALRAQAVTARSYALYELLNGGMGCGGAFCPDTSDQVYRGLESEQASTNAAVEDTAREVVVDGAGETAHTFFHSSSGGRTAASDDVWSGTFSYLKSENDPADLNADNPNRFWRVLRTGAQMRRALGLARTPNDGTLTRDASGRVAQMTMSGAGWTAPVSFPDDTLRGRLDVRSTRFWLDVLRLTVSDGRIEWGQNATLSAFTRGVGNATLERRPFGGAWRDLRAVQGVVTVSVAPTITNWYRLGTPSASVTVRVAVEPKLPFNDRQSQGSLAGSMRPKRAGTTVSVQRLVSGKWRTVATATVTADGAWKAVFSVRAGTYRAYAAPGNGLLAGASPTLEVVTR